MHYCSTLSPRPLYLAYEITHLILHPGGVSEWFEHSGRSILTHPPSGWASSYSTAGTELTPASLFPLLGQACSVRSQLDLVSATQVTQVALHLVNVNALFREGDTASAGSPGSSWGEYLLIPGRHPGMPGRDPSLMLLWKPYPSRLPPFYCRPFH